MGLCRPCWAACGLQTMCVCTPLGTPCPNPIPGPSADFTRSNTWNGKHTFQGRSLHDISRLNGAENPYQRVMRIVASTLAAFDEDNVIPCYGFGDIYTQGQDCFPFFPDRGCNGLGEVLSRYNESDDPLPLFSSPPLSSLLPPSHVFLP